MSVPSDADLRDRHSGAWQYDPIIEAWTTRRRHYFAKFAGAVDECWGVPAREVSVMARGGTLEQTFSEEITIEVADTHELVREFIRSEESLRTLAVSLGSGSKQALAASASGQLQERRNRQDRLQNVRRSVATVTRQVTWSETVTITAATPPTRTFVVPCYQRVRYDVHLEFEDTLEVAYRLKTPFAIRKRKIKNPPGPTTGTGHWTETNQNIARSHVYIGSLEVWRLMPQSAALVEEGDERIGVVKDPFEAVLHRVDEELPPGLCATEEVESLYELTEAQAWPTRL